MRFNGKMRNVRITGCSIHEIHDNLSAAQKMASQFIATPPSLSKYPSKVNHDGFSRCTMVKSRYIGDGHPTFNRNPYNGYINPYYWVDDHPLLYI